MKKITISICAVLAAISAIVIIDISYFRPAAIRNFVNRAYDENSLGALSFEARRGRVRLRLYDASAALQPDCAKILFCFSNVLFDRVDEVIAFSPDGFEFLKGRVLKECDSEYCYKLDRLGVYFEEASKELIDRVADSRMLVDLGCQYYEFQWYSGKYCRQDVIYEGMLTESKIDILAYKPWSYGFLLFDQQYELVGELRLNFLTGNVIARGAAAVPVGG